MLCRVVPSGWNAVDTHYVVLMSRLPPNILWGDPVFGVSFGVSVGLSKEFVGERHRDSGSSAARLGRAERGACDQIAHRAGVGFRNGHAIPRLSMR